MTECQLAICDMGKETGNISICPLLAMFKEFTSPPSAEFSPLTEEEITRIYRHYSGTKNCLRRDEIIAAIARYRKSRMNIRDDGQETPNHQQQITKRLPPTKMDI